MFYFIYMMSVSRLLRGKQHKWVNCLGIWADLDYITICSTSKKNFIEKYIQKNLVSHLSILLQNIITPTREKTLYLVQAYFMSAKNKVYLLYFLKEVTVKYLNSNYYQISAKIITLI